MSSPSSSSSSPDECSWLLVLNTMSLPSSQCQRLLLSRLISLAIVALSGLLRVPQIKKIFPSGNTAGLSPAMFVMQCVGYSVTLVFNYRRGFPVFTYLENLFLLIQTMILVLLVFHYNKNINATFHSGVLLYCAFVGVLLSSSLVSLEVLEVCQMLTIPLFSASVIPQILNNFKNKSTGQLSLISVMLSFIGGLARVFTTLTEVPSTTMLVGYLSGVTLNGTMLLQILLYWKNTSAASEQTIKNKKKR